MGYIFHMQVPRLTLLILTWMKYFKPLIEHQSTRSKIYHRTSRNASKKKLVNVVFTLHIRPGAHYKNKTRQAEGSVVPVSPANAPERVYKLIINI